MVISKTRSHSVTFPNVFDRPGSYTITAAADETTVATATWNASSRYRGDGGVLWRVHVNGPDDVEIVRRS